ncbi:MAG: hypothetical protein GX275_03590 [Clostridiales bacterium]|nr:hypothetical protein [Clostridiales bacterium]
MENNENKELEKKEYEYGKCPTVGYQKVEVSVPITVTPYAKTGKADVYCYGKAEVKHGKEHCKGMENGQCTFTVSQKLLVAVPVVFGAVAKEGGTYVDCKDCYSDKDEKAEGQE